MSLWHLPHIRPFYDKSLARHLHVLFIHQNFNSSSPQSKGVLYKTSARFSDSNSSESIEFFNFFRYISFRFVSIGFVSLCLISFRFFRYISFRFVTFRFVSIGFVSLRSVSFRFVSFGFVSFRSVSLHFCFVSHFTGTRF